MILFFGILIFLLSVLYPPYLGKQKREFMDAPPKLFTKFLGYHLIFIGPPESDSYLYADRLVVVHNAKPEWSNDEPYERKILMPLWLAQFAIIAALTIALLRVFRTRPPKKT
ncbi:MAG: hypothetical protein JW747_01675 [Candidatus Aminicenantes bacterium]|nr:hypothetical protein [Candidatus Aminicenantes bacterium]